jgi:EAL domain-containing protein (putative c-di-GMP-specific phosphodiesterase class I)
VRWFSINISGASVASEEFLEFLEWHDQRLACRRRCSAELTEHPRSRTRPRQPADAARATLGCTFRSTTSALACPRSSTKSLPVSVLKIDGAFVRDAGVNPRTESMVRAIAQMARTMGMETVAEYVETDELRARMAGLGVDYGQGFAIGRPVPIDQVLGDLALYEAMAVT